LNHECEARVWARVKRAWSAS